MFCAHSSGLLLVQGTARFLLRRVYYVTLHGHTADIILDKIGQPETERKCGTNSPLVEQCICICFGGCIWDATASDLAVCPYEVGSEIMKDSLIQNLHSSTFNHAQGSFSCAAVVLSSSEDASNR